MVWPILMIYRPTSYDVFPCKDVPNWGLRGIVSFTSHPYAMPYLSTLYYANLSSLASQREDLPCSFFL